MRIDRDEVGMNSGVPEMNHGKAMRLSKLGKQEYLPKMVLGHRVTLATVRMVAVKCLGRHRMKTVMGLVIALIAASSGAEERPIYRTDPYGRIQHAKPSLVVREGGQVIRQDPYGNPQPQKGGFKIEGNRVYRTDMYGRVKSNVSSYEVEKDSRIIEVSPYGAKRYDKPQYRVEGNRVYQLDRTGQIDHSKPSLTVEAGK